MSINCSYLNLDANPFGSSATQIQVISDIWLYDAKNWLKVRNMNKALTEVLMKLLPTAISLGYVKVLSNDLNRDLGVTLEYFYTMLDNNVPLEKEASRMAMLSMW